jgi:hypothetical protein
MIPLAGGILVVAALASRRGEPMPAKKAAASLPIAAREAPSLPWGEGKPLVAATPESRPQAAPEKTVAARSEEVRVRSTYQNYRTAVATGNSALEQALRPAVLRERETTLAYAQQDLARAQTDLDRDIARKVIEAMRR